jgi:hypothetical protein
MDPSLTERPALGKSEPGEKAFYGITPREVLSRRDISLGAKALYSVLDSRLGGRSIRVSRLVLADDLGLDVRSIAIYLQELKFAGLLTVKRTGRTSSYTLVNLVRDRAKEARKEKDFLSDRKDPSYLQSSKERVIKSNNKQDEEAPLERSSLGSAAAVVKPFRELEKPKLDYVKAFNSSLEVNLGNSLDLNSLKRETLEAILKAQEQGLKASEFAARCSQKVKERQQEKAFSASPIRNPVAYLVSVLPSLADSEAWSSSTNPEVWSSSTNPEVWTVDQLPHTLPFYDLFQQEAEPTPDPEAKAEAEALLEPFRKKAEILKKQGKL